MTNDAEAAWADPGAGTRRPGSDNRGLPDADRMPQQPVPLTDEEPDVGLSQKGSGEEAVVRRETDL